MRTRARLKLLRLVEANVIASCEEVHLVAVRSLKLLLFLKVLLPFRCTNNNQVCVCVLCVCVCVCVCVSVCLCLCLCVSGFVAPSATDDAAAKLTFKALFVSLHLGVGWEMRLQILTQGLPATTDTHHNALHECSSGQVQKREIISEKGEKEEGGGKPRTHTHAHTK